MIKYMHALALNPYFGDSTALMGVSPSIGLEYIAASLKDLVGKVTLLDLRFEKIYQDPKALSKFIRNKIDLLCVSIRHPLPDITHIPFPDRSLHQAQGGHRGTRGRNSNEQIPQGVYPH